MEEASNVLSIEYNHVIIISWYDFGGKYIW